MRTLLPLAALVTLAGPVACGPAPTPVAPTAQRGAESPPAAQVAADAKLDLSPVAEPADIVGLARWGSPSSTLSDLTGCAGLPPAFADGLTKGLVARILEELVSGATDSQQLASAVALDAPVHLLVTLDNSAKRGKPLAAVSLGLSSLEQARTVIEKGATLTETAPGMWKLDAKNRANSSCFIAASAGSTPARLICGDRDRDVIALGPYLARTLPTLAPDARDVHVEIRLAPLSAKFGGLAKQQLRGLPILAQSQLSIGEPKFDRALGDAASAIQDELTALIGDADKATFDLDVDSKSCLGATEAIQLRGRASWLAGTMADSAAQAGPAPALYWRMPKDSDTAFFGRAADPARYEGVFKTLRALLEGYLNKENAGKPQDRRALADLIATPMSKGTSSVSAHGHVAPPAPAAAKGAKTSSIPALEGTLASWIGWNLVGLDEAPAATAKYLKDLVAVYNRPALLAALKKQLGADDAKRLPTLKTVPAPKELGKSGLAVEITFKELPAPDAGLGAEPWKPGAKPNTVTLTLHLLLMGEDTTTWIAFGQDKRELLKRLAAVKAGAPDAETLASRPGLEGFKTGKMVSGGFMTIAPLTRAFESGLSLATGAAPGALPREVQELAGVLGNLPHKGHGLMLLTSQVQGGDAPRAEISFNLTKPALEDVGAVVLAGLKLAGILSP